MTNFKEVGTWWNDKSIELIEIDGSVYALNGWNGEEYTACFKVGGQFNMDILSKEIYNIRPKYKKIAEDEYEIIGYEVSNY
jgi:hypothetical protein